MRLKSLLIALAATVTLMTAARAQDTYVIGLTGALSGPPLASRGRRAIKLSLRQLPNAKPDANAFATLPKCSSVSKARHRSILRMPEQDIQDR